MINFTDKEQIVLDYAAGDRVLYIALDQAVRRGISLVRYADQDGVLLYVPCAETWLLSAKNEDTCRKLLEQTGPGQWVVLHDISYWHILEKAGLRCFQEPAYSAAYLQKTIKPYTPEGVEIRPLAPEHLPVVKENYLLENDEAYLLERINEGMLGAFKGNTLMGFVGTHDEGSMGLLEVLPQYRRQGLGTALSTHMIAWELAKGHIPYDQYFISNQLSHDLQSKLGFSFSSQPLIWMKTPGGDEQ